MSNRDLFWIDELARHWRLTLWQHRCLVKVDKLGDEKQSVEARELRQRWLSMRESDADWMPGNRVKLYDALSPTSQMDDEQFVRHLDAIGKAFGLFREIVESCHKTTINWAGHEAQLHSCLSSCFDRASRPCVENESDIRQHGALPECNYSVSPDEAAKNWIRMAIRLGEWRKFSRHVEKAIDLQQTADNIEKLKKAQDEFAESLDNRSHRTLLFEFLNPGKGELEDLVKKCSQQIRASTKVLSLLMAGMPEWSPNVKSIRLSFEKTSDELLDVTWPPVVILDFVERVRQTNPGLRMHELLQSCLGDEKHEQRLRDECINHGIPHGEARARLFVYRRLFDGLSAQLVGDRLLGVMREFEWLWSETRLRGLLEIPNVAVDFNNSLSNYDEAEQRLVEYHFPFRVLAARMWLERGSVEGVPRRELLRPATVEIPRKLAPLVVPLQHCADLCQPYDSRLSELCRDLAKELMAGINLRAWLTGSAERIVSRREHLWHLATRLELSLFAAHEQILLDQRRRADQGQTVTTVTSDVVGRFTCLEQVSDELAKEGVEWVNTIDRTIRDASELPELRVAPDALAAVPGMRRVVRMPGAVLRLPDGHERRSVVWCRLAQSEDTDSSGSLLTRWRDADVFERLRREDSAWSGWSQVDLTLSSLTLGDGASAEMDASEGLFELFYRRHLDVRDELKGSYRNAAAFLMRQLVELRGGRPIRPSLDSATLAPLPPSDADASLLDTTWVVDGSPAGTPLRIEAFQFGQRRGRLVRSLGPQPLPEIKAWFELPPFPRSWASEPVQVAVTALRRAFEAAAAASDGSALGIALPAWKKWLATPDGEEWLNRAIEAARRAWRTELQPESQRGAPSPTLPDEAKWIDFFKRSSSWPCYPDYDPLRDVVAWPKNQSTIGAAVAWDFDDQVPRGSCLGSQPVRFATRPEMAQGTFSLGPKGTIKTLDASWALSQWSRDNHRAIPKTSDVIARVAQAMRDREFLAGGGGESPDKLVHEELKRALKLLSQETTVGDQTPRDEALRHLREAAQAVDLDILPAEWSFVSPPSVSDIKHETPDARFEFRFSRSGRKAGHVLCDFALQRRTPAHDQAAKTRFPGCYYVSSGPFPDGWQELQAVIERLPPSIQEIVKPSIDDWPRAAAENDGDPVYAVERFVTKLWDEGQVRIAEARLDLKPLEMAVKRVLQVFNLELYRPESLNEFSDWRSFVEVEGAVGDSRRISRVYRPGLRTITGHECRLRARVITE